MLNIIVKKCLLRIWKSRYKVNQIENRNKGEYRADTRRIISEEKDTI